jgi:hypothetical protein
MRTVRDDDEDAARRIGQKLSERVYEPAAVEMFRRKRERERLREMKPQGGVQ